MVLRLKITVLFTYRRVRHFCEHRVEMAVGSGSFAAFAFTGTLTVARATTRPRSKVLMAGESTHVGPGFCQQSPSAALAHSRYRIELLDGGTKRRGRYGPQSLVHAGDLLFQKVVLIKQLAQQKAVMLGQLSVQGALQLRYLLPQLLLGEIGQYRCIFLATDQRFNHLSPRCPQHI